MRWGEKRFHSLDYELKKTFGRKLAKVSLNGGMTCPNRDGRIDTRGCIFCSAGGSGDFAQDPSLPVLEQIDAADQKRRDQKKPPLDYIAYFQAYTNTYAPVTRLRSLYDAAISHPRVAALSIATRPDCLPEEVLKLLAEEAKKKPVWVELGLQTSNEATARYIRRGYPNQVFETAVEQLSFLKIPVIVHIILGLPNESPEDVLQTIRYLNRFPIQGIKLQLLHVLAHTDLAKQYKSFHILSREEYTDLVIFALEQLNPDFVIHRLTGDGPKELLLAPLWSREKIMVLNEINQKLRLRDSWQGKYFTPANPAL